MLSVSLFKRLNKEESLYQSFHCHNVLLRVKPTSMMPCSTQPMPFAHHWKPLTLSSGDKSCPVNSPLTNNFSKRVPLQSHCPKQASEEMVKVGLVESSRLLHPFNQPDDTDLSRRAQFPTQHSSLIRFPFKSTHMSFQHQLRPLQYSSQGFSPTQQRWDTRTRTLCY